MRYDNVLCSRIVGMRVDLTRNGRPGCELVVTDADQDNRGTCHVLYEIRCEGRSPSYAEAAGECCCQVDELCVVGGLGPDAEFFFTPVGFVPRSLFHFAISFRMKGTQGEVRHGEDNCLIEYYETLDPGSPAQLRFPPGGYTDLVFEGWQYFSLIGDHQDAFQEKQTCPNPTRWHTFSDKPGYVPGTRAGITSANSRLLSWFTVRSAPHGDCARSKCCALVTVDFATSITHVLGPTCGTLCEKPPDHKKRPMLPLAGLVTDGVRTFMAFASVSGLQPWQLNRSLVEDTQSDLQDMSWLPAQIQASTRASVRCAK